MGRDVLYGDFKMIILIFSVTMSLFLSTECSVVIDSSSHDHPYIAKYCPQTESCQEGSHVMCLLYRPDRTESPRCINLQNVSMDARVANIFLDVFNAMRSRTALGLERGQGGEYLPRGFGLYRLAWDNELAMFAQEIVNQCRVNRGLCRGTKQFPDPVIVGALARFTYPDWMPVSSASSKLRYPGLDNKKINIGIVQIMDFMYTSKDHVNTAMVRNYPDYSINGSEQTSKNYLDIVNNNSTHVGCGMSAYSGHLLNNLPRKPVTYNYILVACILSAQAHKGSMAYNTIQPVRGTASKCGCPFDISTEDDSCLCIRKMSAPKSLIQKEIQTCPTNSSNCKPTVVILPIFTVEEAPPRNLPGRKRFTDLVNRAAAHLSSLRRPKREVKGKAFGILSKMGSSILPNKPSMEKGNRSFDIRLESNNRTDLILFPVPIKAVGRDTVKKKTSLFSKAKPFQVPAHMINNNANINTTNTYKFEFENKVFSNSEQGNYTINDIFRQKTRTGVPQYVDFRNEHEKEDNKLFKLLDNLEQEVKHTELHKREKDIFNAKIRNIYKSLVEEPTELLTRTRAEKLKEMDLDFVKSNNMKELPETQIKDTSEVAGGNPHYLHFDDAITQRAGIKKQINKGIHSRKIDSYYDKTNSRGSSYSRPITSVRPHLRYMEKPDTVYYKNYKFINLHEFRPEDKNEYSDYRNTNIKEDFEIPKYRNNRKDGIFKISSHYNNDVEEDGSLNIDKRQYYHEKHENIQKKNHNRWIVKGRYGKEINHHTRRLKSLIGDMQMRPSRPKKRINSFYLTDRARVLHAY